MCCKGVSLADCLYKEEKQDKKYGSGHFQLSQYKVAKV